MSKRSIYEEQVAPLIDQIYDLCERNKISMLAHFNLHDDANPNLTVSNFLVSTDEEDDHIDAAIGVLLEGAVDEDDFQKPDGVTIN